jgi:hypothetical protein
MANLHSFPPDDANLSIAPVTPASLIVVIFESISLIVMAAGAVLVVAAP